MDKDEPDRDPGVIPGSDSLTVLTARIRDLLAARGATKPYLTYQAVAKALGLTPPGVIQTVARALEKTMSEDVQAGRPMIAALVVSRTGELPRRGFFDLAVALGRFQQDPASHHAAWQAECRAALGMMDG